MRSSRRRWILTFAAAGLLAASLPWLRGYQQAWLAREIAAELATAPKAEVATIVERMVRLDDAGLAVLTQALQSPRRDVAEAASSALHMELARWELLPHDEGAKRIEQLAGELSRQINQLDLTRRRPAASLARRIIAWPRFEQLPNSPSVLASCDRILAASQGLPGTPTDPLLVMESIDERPPTTVARAEHLTLVAPAPGGDDDRAAALEAPATLADTSPGLLPLDMTHARQLPSGPDAEVLATDRSQNASANVPASLNLAVRYDSTSIQPTAIDFPRDTFDLVPQLSSPDPIVATRAEAELRRRGFSSVHLQVAKRLSDTDAAVRARWTTALPGISDLDARPWLLWLCHDADAEVRLAAITLLATSGDPNLVRRALEAARRDSDPRALRVAEQLAPTK